MAEPSAIWDFTWWTHLEQDKDFQTNARYGLAAAYGCIAFVALVQLARIQTRVPEYGWTTQKVFHFLNSLVAGVRCGCFLLCPQLEPDDGPDTLQRLVLMGLPGLLFFTTYTLLVLFWAEIYHQARSMPIDSLRPLFLIFNAVVYIIQASFWVLTLHGGSDRLQQVGLWGSDAFLALTALMAATGFLLYGGRLFLMLQCFPIESRGRRNKLREVGLVTTLCAGCFALRALMVAASALNPDDLQLDRVDHPLPNLIYYSLVEVLPSACVLCILRKLPPRRIASDEYQPMPSE